MTAYPGGLVTSTTPQSAIDGWADRAEVDATPDHMLPWPNGRISARQAAERMAAGLRCRFCERADLKLIKLPRLVGYGCMKCARTKKKTDSAKRRDAHQQRTFGITLEEAKLIEAHQGDGCVCAPWTNYDGSGKRALSTDHDHKTGEIRGRLCKHCNDLLGRIMDDPTYLRAMIHYLENPPARAIVGVRIVPDHKPSA